ncbi:MAG: hypothetical protein EB053_04625 [Chlamydiae bacterium]|nr:hypothetical protein [Chlamydiota bacterium]
MTRLRYQICEPASHSFPLKTVIFFTTTAKEALEVPPLCNPSNFLIEHQIRVISFDLPLHNEEIPSFDGVKRWTNHMEKTQEDILSIFLSEVSEWIDQNLDPMTPLGFMGISRGAFLAAHLASYRKKKNPLVLFSPMHDLEYPWLWSDSKNQPLFIEKFRLNRICPFLKDCPLFLSVGNNDERVNTHQLIRFYEELIESKKKEQSRNIPIELHVFPSIGMYGHGTSDHIFSQGASWMHHML